MRKRSFFVTVELPHNVGPATMRAYIREAVQTWCKSFDPGDLIREGDPLFDLDASTVKVKIVPEGEPVR